MRGKLYSYKTPAAGRPGLTQQQPNPGQMNLAAYQAFALQQRAILQHALTYESLIQNSVAMTTSHYLQQSGRSLASLPPMSLNNTDVITSINKPLHSQDSNGTKLTSPDGERSLKLEQVGQVRFIPTFMFLLFFFQIQIDLEFDCQ